MLAIRLVASAALCAGVAATAAPPKDYAEATSAYKSDLAREDSVPVNAEFICNLASSQAKRKARTEEAATADAAEVPSRFEGFGGLTGRGVSVASPQIFGTVRGDVTIVVDRHAVRGSITSLRR